MRYDELAYDTVILYPQGTPYRGAKNNWNDGRGITPGAPTATDNPDDVGFLSALIDYAVEVYGVDPTRVFFEGVSNGASMTNLLAVDPRSSGKIAGVGISHVWKEENVAALAPSHPMHVLQMNGTRDTGDHSPVPIVKLTEDETMRDWLGDNYGVDANPDDLGPPADLSVGAAVVPLEDIDPRDGTTSVQTTWGTNGGAVVSKITIFEGGHSIPGNRNVVNADIRLLIDTGPTDVTVGKGFISRDFRSSQGFFDFFIDKSILSCPVTICAE